MEELIWNYLDNTCTTGERQQVELMLNENEEFKAKFYEIKALHQALFEADLDEPSMRFSMNVMDKINATVPVKPLSTIVDKRIINGIGFFLVGTILLLLAYLIANTTFSSNNSVQNYLPSFDFAKMMSSNFTTTFLVFDSVLLLFLFERYLHWQSVKRDIPQ